VHGAPGQLSGEPFEGLLKVVVGLGRDVVVLQILLAMEVDLRKQTQGGHSVASKRKCSNARGFTVQSLMQPGEAMLDGL
jgi:hypothetical protein